MLLSTILPIYIADTVENVEFEIYGRVKLKPEYIERIRCYHCCADKNVYNVIGSQIVRNRMKFFR